MGQVINFQNYKKVRNSEELQRIKKLEQQLNSLEIVLHTSGSVSVRERAAIEMSDVKMEIVDRMLKLGILQ